MGYACPDSAACDANYYGIYNQLYSAAWAFQYYRTHPNNYRHKPLQSSDVLYHPNTSCGTKRVYIQNFATAGLYTYTPYTPNNAAINAGQGLGDSCSSYGNRNFFNYYSMWFGDPKTGSRFIWAPEKIMMFKNNLQKVDPNTGAKSGTSYAAGLVRKFVDEAWTPSGKCYRTESDRNAKKSTCILESDLQSSGGLSSGAYLLRPLNSKNRVLDIDWAGKNRGANLAIFDRNNTEAQKFNIYNDGSGLYRITNVNSGLSLDVQNAGTANGANVQQWDKNDTCAQKWAPFFDKNGHVTLYSLCSARVLDIAGGVDKNSTNVQLWDANGSNAQKFELIRVNHNLMNGIFSLQSAANQKKVLDIEGASTSEGAKAHLWDNVNLPQQRFKFVYNADDGTYTLVNAKSGLVLDVRGGSTENGAVIQQWSSNGTNAQRWKILKENGKYIFLSASTALALDIQGGVIENGRTIQQWSNNGTIAQRWYLQKK
jgi:hypothetical protein